MALIIRNVADPWSKTLGYTTYLKKMGQKRGVMILMSQKVAFKYIYEEANKKRGCIVVSGKVNNAVIKICNVYMFTVCLIGIAIDLPAVTLALSDHAPVFCTIHIGNNPRNTLWRLNTGALQKTLSL